MAFFGSEPVEAEDLGRLERRRGLWRGELVVAGVPLDRVLTVELGLRAPWDEEHTLGARIRDGALVELNDSVLAP